MLLDGQLIGALLGLLELGIIFAVGGLIHLYEKRSKLSKSKLAFKFNLKKI